MYLYIWKDPQSVPFYVGLTKNKRRANPRNNGNRNWLCRQKLLEIGEGNVIVELRPVASEELGIALEQKLIAEYGRIQTGTGPLTNLTSGGEGTRSPSAEHRAKLRNAMLNPSHPARSAAARERQRARMRDSDVRVKIVGEANPAKRLEVREKLKAKWADPEYRAKMTAARSGKKRTLSPESKRKLRDHVLNSAMREYHKTLNTDPEIKKRRVAGIRAAQDTRRIKMADPAALAQRKSRLQDTLKSPEYLAKRAMWDTPEYRAKLSAAKKAYWEKNR